MAMQSLMITDLKRITALLFTENSFDRFLLKSVQLSAQLSVTISGEKDPDFYAEEEREKEMQDAFVRYETVRPLLYSLIKGKRPPLSFRIILITDKNTTNRLKVKSGFTDCDVTSLSINLNYRSSQLVLSTGVSYAGFSLDKSLEDAWEKAVRDFLDEKGVTYEVL